MSTSFKDAFNKVGVYMSSELILEKMVKNLDKCLDKSSGEKSHLWYSRAEEWRRKIIVHCMENGFKIPEHCRLRS